MRIKSWVILFILFFIRVQGDIAKCDRYHLRMSNHGCLGLYLALVPWAQAIISDSRIVRGSGIRYNSDS